MCPPPFPHSPRGERSCHPIQAALKLEDGKAQWAGQVWGLGPGLQFGSLQVPFFLADHPPRLIPPPPNPIPRENLEGSFSPGAVSTPGRRSLGLTKQWVNLGARSCGIQSREMGPRGGRSAARREQTWAGSGQPLTPYPPPAGPDVQFDVSSHGSTPLPQQLLCP